jgi:hypothetical protein
MPASPKDAYLALKEPGAPSYDAMYELGGGVRLLVPGVHHGPP